MTQTPLSILILSHDDYSDVWDITFNAFFENWKDCPYKIYLLTNHKEFSDKRITSIKIGDYTSWSENLLKGLKEIDTNYILALFDDFILKSPINNIEIEKYFNIVSKNNYDYLRLQPEPPPDERISQEFGRITEGALYRPTLCTAIIKKSSLQSLLRVGENAWEFEFEGSIRSDKFYHFYSTYNTIMPYHNAIQRGKWNKEIVEIVKSFNIDVNIRGIYTEVQVSNRWNLLYKLKRKILFELIPPKSRRTFLNLYQRAVRAMS